MHKALTIVLLGILLVGCSTTLDTSSTNPPTAPHSTSSPPTTQHPATENNSQHTTTQNDSQYPTTQNDSQHTATNDYVAGRELFKLQRDSDSALGQRVTDFFPLPAGAVLVETRHFGAQQFKANLVSKTGDIFPLVNDEGYILTTTLHSFAAGQYLLDMIINGEVTFIIRTPDIEEATSWSGAGKKFTPFFTLSGTNTFEMSFQGNGLYIVSLYNQAGERIAVLAQGDTTEKTNTDVTVPQGLYLLGIESTGVWDIQLK
ncbi:hypothetical protein GF342_00355 [Candidatus Woesearchaeota archaeon]|nr:hypothetical protein [Candidatus Woesearchaeota archaeon]